MKARLRFCTVLLTLSLSATAFADDGISWNQLTVEQQQVLSKLEADWDALTPQRQQRLALGADRWSQMDAEQRSQAKRRFGDWRALTDMRRERIRDAYEIYRDLPPAEQRKIRENFRRFQEMKRERRQQLRERYRNMTPEQRKRVRDRLVDRQRARQRNN